MVTWHVIGPLHAHVMALHAHVMGLLHVCNAKLNTIAQGSYALHRLRHFNTYLLCDLLACKLLNYDRTQIIRHTSTAHHTCPTQNTHKTCSCFTDARCALRCSALCFAASRRASRCAQSRRTSRCAQSRRAPLCRAGRVAAPR